MRDDFCSLTGSRPHQQSAIWYQEPLSVLNGFETQFSFQVSDHSRRCYEATDQHFSGRHYRVRTTLKGDDAQNCVVQGGDGFAFVIHGDDNKTDAIGRTGGDIGYGGIRNSIAIEFDTWQNADPSDIIWDHVTYVRFHRMLTTVASIRMEYCPTVPRKMLD